uniref:Uncharacterized protein n=1 Tax=Cucumis melo TaxID=3656 RepID=A0A9I9EEF3_CUCME
MSGGQKIIWAIGFRVLFFLSSSAQPISLLFFRKFSFRTTDLSLLFPLSVAIAAVTPRHQPQSATAVNRSPSVAVCNRRHTSLIAAVESKKHRKGRRRRRNRKERNKKRKKKRKPTDPNRIDRQLDRRVSLELTVESVRGGLVEKPTPTARCSPLVPISITSQWPPLSSKVTSYTLHSRFTIHLLLQIIDRDMMLLA